MSVYIERGSIVCSYITIGVYRFYRETFCKNNLLLPCVY